MSDIVDAHVAYIRTISDLNQDKAELLERIKRLEEAGDTMADLLEEEMFMKLAVQWRKAKEAKL